MAENTQQQQAQFPVNDTQGVSMPNTQQQAQKTPEIPVDQGQKDVLPSEVKERTKNEFEKLQSQLREERSKREQIESAYQTLLQPKKQIEQEPPIYDPTTGLIDGQVLTQLQKEAKEAKLEAQKAREEVTSYRQKDEYSKAYSKHPWTNPDSKDFDEKRSNLAAAIALASMVEPKRYGGKQLDLEGAASFVEGLSQKQVEQVKQEAAQEAIEQLSPKEQAALEATGSSGRREPEASIDYDTVRNITRKGGTDGLTATMARLRALKKSQATSA